MFTTHFPWLTTIVLFPLLSSLLIPLIPTKEGKNIRTFALGVALADFAIAISAFWNNFNLENTEFQLVDTYSWIPQLGVNWSLGVDGISMPLIILACFVTTLAILASWRVKHRPKLFYTLMLVMYAAQIGVLAAKDMFLFFVMWELELVPVYLLISIWGSERSRYASTKFILYNALASIFILVGALALAFYGDNFTFDIAELAAKDYPLGLATLVYAGFLIAFAVKMPIFPFHTWLPDAHQASLAAVSMVITGVLKMGSYGLIRYNVEMFPEAHMSFAPVLVILGVVNIVYGAIVAFGQTHLMRRLAYAAISHMGFVLIGIGAYTAVGMNGAMLQLISHGLIAAAMFFLAGVAYKSAGSLWMDKITGLAKEMPKTFALFSILVMAGVGLPGTSAFVAEITVFLGMATSDVYSTAFKVMVIFLAAVGVIVTPIYFLSTLRVIFYGKNENGFKVDKYEIDANPREVFIAASIIIPVIAVGFYPKLLTNTYDAKTVELANRAQAVIPVVAQQQEKSVEANLPAPLATEAFIAPTLK